MLNRLFNLVAAALGLLTVSPLLLMMMVMIRLKLGSPVFFCQERPGLHEKPFHIIKFRTMNDARDQAGNLLSDGERLTGFGRFLRRSSLDELPELLNVVRGEMNLVGPRPLLMRYLPYFTAQERIRFSIRPGITGWAQINGRNEATWDDRLSNDLWYVENRNLWLDVKILALTVLKVFRRKGAVADARSIMLNLDEERSHMREGRNEN